MYKVLKFSLAREAFKYLIIEYGIKKIHLPYYLCDVIRHTVAQTDCDIEFYHIDDNFLPDKNFEKKDYILYPNYFGVCDNNVDNLSKNYPNIIIDNAHSYYSAPKGFASFNSERKFVNNRNNAYLYLKSDTDEQIQISDTPKIRTDKFIELHNEYSSTNELNINIKYAKSPFCYPYLAKTEEIANEVVNKLTRNGYTIYRYWNNLPKTYNEYKFYSRLVPIPLTDKKLPE